MTKKSKKLQPVADLAKQNERSAARLHGGVLHELQQQENQLNELIAYRDQYLDAFKTSCESGLSVVQMQDYRVFLLRLDDAIKKQQQAVSNGRQNCESSKTKWVDKRNRSKMINKVVENRQRVEDQKLDRLEQRELEDRPLIKR